ncbi:MAG: site-2 protease family protein [Theionarchaea archaeon]|nr:site-2 protease family protein [Theionarchaea archaeon]MBU6999551.1 site-2 protease family protein [Theionarchaea archaeon]MBU7020285.1 site-2 protease family protein [Theionarchaea archaeon]MBU7035170.1 site-2 protease family protein [Theionarchaea archaeon]
MIEYVLLGIALLWLILAALVKKFNLEERGVTIVPLLFFMVRTKKFLHLMDALAQKAKSFWAGYSLVGVAVSVVGIPVSLGFFAWNAYKVLSAPQQATAVVPVIPGVTIKVTWGLIIGIIIIFFAHEFSHGIVARSENISLKSTGLLLLVVIPGAFVEPDEEEMKQKSVLSRVKVYSAGSMANFLVAAFFLVLLLSIPRIPDGVQIYETIPGTPADQIGLEGAIIYQMDGSAVDTYEQFSQELERYNPGDELTLDTNRGILTLTLTEHPDEEGQGYMGVYPIQHYKYFMILDIFSWISMLNLSVALFNLFPISSILDGGKITDEILRHYFSDTTSRRLSAAFGVIALGILAVNLLGNVIA